MMEKKQAIEIKKYSLDAISELSKILSIQRESVSEEEYDRLKKGVGTAIGDIQVNLLDIIYSQYPDIDDLK
ncbi:Uncharacterised protein [Salmonella enterica subsp. salamae]|nr:Uncharacterised protein [Salmonella enterica subsp. salamae]